MNTPDLNDLMQAADDSLTEVLEDFIGRTKLGRRSLAALASALLRASTPDSLGILAADREILLHQAEELDNSDIGDDHTFLAALEYSTRAARQLMRSERPLTIPVLLRGIVGLPPPVSGLERSLQLRLLEHGITGLGPLPGAPNAVPVQYAPLGYGEDLNKKMALVQASPLIGRQVELGQVMRLLMAGRNPVLTGEPGVGKSALVEGLAWKIAHQDGDIPEPLRTIQLVNVPVNELISDTGVQGALERRLKAFLDHLFAHPNVVIFIDEIHALMLSGAGGGKVIVNTLKPALAREGIRVIGATTDREYQQYFAGDRALTERFRDIGLREPSPEDVVSMLTQRGDRLLTTTLRQQGIVVSDKAIAAAVQISMQNFKDSRMPRKPVNLLQEAAAIRSIRHWCAPDQISKVMDQSDVQYAAAEALGLAPEALQAGFRGRAERLSLALTEAIKGQDEACQIIVETLSLSFAGLVEPAQPRAVFLFWGPPGTGKSTCAEVLAESVCGSRHALFTIAAPDLMGEGGRNLLIGPSPGYRDSGDTWTVFSTVRSRPATLVVFDEIDELAVGVQRKISEMLSGRAGDGMARPTDFSQCVFVLVAAPRLTEVLAKERTETGRVEILRRALGRGVAERIDSAILFSALSPMDLAAILENTLTRKAATIVHDPEAAMLVAALRNEAVTRRILELAQQLGGNGHALLAAMRKESPKILKLNDKAGGPHGVTNTA